MALGVVAARTGALLTATVAALHAAPSCARGQEAGPRVSIPAAVYPARRARVLDALGSRVLIVPSKGAFKTDDQAGFKQATDFQYLTGAADLVGAVLVLRGDTRDATLFLGPPNPVITRSRPSLGDAGARALGLSAVLPIDSLAPWLGTRIATATAILVSPDDPRGQVAVPPPMAGTVARWRDWLRQLGYAGEVTSATPLVRAQRSIKEPAEVGVIERVAQASGRAMLAGMRALAPGRRQRDAESAVVSACIQAGGVHSFWPWAMSGTRGAYTDLFNSFVDYDNHDREMRAGELVRVDVGCQLEQYMGDVGRTVPVSGRFTDGQREAWDLFIAGYRAGLAELRPGATAAQVYEAARRRIRALAPSMKTDLGRRAATELLSPRGVEAWELHHVGLDDAEGMADELRPGMVFAYEIMFALDGEGYYLEDLILIEANGYRLLTASLPYTASEIESAMQRRGNR